jgi:sensor histidine kinase YesM
VLFGAAWVWIYHRSDRLLDRLLFNRPDYRELLQEISASMSRCADVESLVNLVRERLGTALGIDSVEFVETLDKRASLIIRIGPPERTRGYLVLGPRSRGQSYRSEDLNFLDAIAAQFSGLLESFEARQARHLAVRSELKALRAQINPHFLFNALNTLADMAKDRPEAEQTILHLSKVFRYVLDSTRRETVPLREEIAFIRSYLEIEQARFEDKLRFEIDVPDALLDEPVPPMLLQPLVENAIKHGIAPKIGGGAIRISALRSEHGLRFTVSDDGVGFDPARAKMNVGIANVRARVEALGGGWTLQSAPEQGTSISFELAIP